MTSSTPTPTFVIHRESATGWRSTFHCGNVASRHAAMYADACDHEAAIRAALGPAYVTCDHHAIRADEAR